VRGASYEINILLRLAIWDSSSRKDSNTILTITLERDRQDRYTRNNRYKNVLDLSITLIVVNVIG
jgi:hypothetical protein